MASFVEKQQKSSNITWGKILGAVGVGTGVALTGVGLLTGNDLAEAAAEQVTDYLGNNADTAAEAATEPAKIFTDVIHNAEKNQALMEWASDTMRGPMVNGMDMFFKTGQAISEYTGVVNEYTSEVAQNLSESTDATAVSEKMQMPFIESDRIPVGELADAAETQPVTSVDTTNTTAEATLNELIIEEPPTPNPIPNNVTQATQAEIAQAANAATNQPLPPVADSGGLGLQESFSASANATIPSTETSDIAVASPTESLNIEQPPSPLLGSSETVAAVAETSAETAATNATELQTERPPSPLTDSTEAVAAAANVAETLAEPRDVFINGLVSLAQNTPMEELAETTKEYLTSYLDTLNNAKLGDVAKAVSESAPNPGDLKEATLGVEGFVQADKGLVAEVTNIIGNDKLSPAQMAEQIKDLDTTLRAQIEHFPVKDFVKTVDDVSVGEVAETAKNYLTKALENLPTSNNGSFLTRNATTLTGAGLTAGSLAYLNHAANKTPDYAKVSDEQLQRERISQVEKLKLQQIRAITEARRQASEGPQPQGPAI